MLREYSKSSRDLDNISFDKMSYTLTLSQFPGVSSRNKTLSKVSVKEKLNIWHEAIWKYIKIMLTKLLLRKQWL